MSGTLVQGVPFWKQALLDFKNIIRNPKLHINILQVSSDIDDRNTDYEEFGTELVNELETSLKFAHQLNVKKIFFRASSVQPLLKILPRLKPGYLTQIEIALDYPSDVMMEEVIEIEQWKQAKYLITYKLYFVGSLRHLFHFKEFDVGLNGISVVDIRQMKEVLFKSTDFKKCSFSFKIPTDTSTIRQEFGDPIRGCTNTYHYPVPNISEYFEIKFTECGIDIARKKK